MPEYSPDPGFRGKKRMRPAWPEWNMTRPVQQSIHRQFLLQALRLRIQRVDLLEILTMKSRMKRLKNGMLLRPGI
jgi:hypothetical protein